MIYLHPIRSHPIHIQIQIQVRSDRPVHLRPILAFFPFFSTAARLIVLERHLEHDSAVPPLRGRAVVVVVREALPPAEAVLLAERGDDAEAAGLGAGVIIIVVVVLFGF